MNICKCGAEAVRHRRVCAKCLYQSQIEYRKKWHSAEYAKQYAKANRERLRAYGTMKAREYRAAKKAAEKRAAIVARRPWHEQEAMRL